MPMTKAALIAPDYPVDTRAQTLAQEPESPAATELPPEPASSTDTFNPKLAS
jgi:hypothetical protein